MLLVFGFSKKDYKIADNDQTAYGALVEGEAVCAGYARAYQLLLEAAGVKAWTVVGDSIDPSSGYAVPHAWSLMWLDDDCYYTDVTWDDQGDTPFHEFFIRSQAEFSGTHVPSAVYQAMLPTCGHNDYDYFTLEAYEGSSVGGIADDSTSASEVFDYIKVRQADGYTYAIINIWYNGRDFGNWLNGYVRYVADALKMNGYYCTYSCMTNEYQVVLVSGIGSVHTQAGEGNLKLALSYQGAGLTEGGKYDLLVAYYTDDGQFIEMDTLQITMGRYGMASVSAVCPEAFGICKVFMPEVDTFVPFLLQN